MAARKTTKTAVIDPDLIDIADFCTAQGINEQIFRLELMQFVDNADSAKVVAFDLATSVASTITAPQAALPQIVDQVKTPENLTPQELQPSQETAAEVPQKQQNSSIATSSPKAISNPATGGTVPTALTEFINKSQDEIELFDLIQVYRNEQILSNADARDSELVVKLRERRIETRNQVFDSLRDLNGKQPIPQELPELPPNLKDENKSLSDELGKKLSA